MLGQMCCFTVALLYLLSSLPDGISASAQCSQRSSQDGHCILGAAEKAKATDDYAMLVQSKLVLRESLHAPQQQNRTSVELLANIAPYKGHALISATPVSHEQLEAVKKLVMGHIDKGVDAWTEQIGLHLPADLMVPGTALPAVENFMKDAGMEPEVLLRDVAEKLQSDHDANKMQVQKGVVGSYPNLDELYGWYDSLVRQYSFVSVFSIGTTHENRDIKVVKIARHSGLPIVLIECGTHAREWISVASCVWHINELLTSSDPSVEELSEKIEFQIIPCHNPDGYEWTHVGDRLWRKNRNPNGGHRCKGVDLNRNWDSRWGKDSVSLDKCETMYCGAQPFSEPETKALAEHMIADKERFKAFIEFHSFGQHWLVPPSSGPKPSDFRTLQEVGEQAVQKMQQIAGHVYDAGSSEDILYAYGGGSSDWAHNASKGPGIKYTYTTELRPSGRSINGFELPVREIPEASQEAFAGLKYVAQVVMEEIARPAQPTPASSPTPARIPTPPLA